MPLQDLALDAVQTVMVKHEGADPEIDIKKYAKVEKLPGGSLDDCRYSARHSSHCTLLCKSTEEPASVPNTCILPRRSLLFSQERRLRDRGMCMPCAVGN